MIVSPIGSSLGMCFFYHLIKYFPMGHQGTLFFGLSMSRSLLSPPGTDHSGPHVCTHLLLYCSARDICALNPPGVVGASRKSIVVRDVPCAILAAPGHSRWACSVVGTVCLPHEGHFSCLPHGGLPCILHSHHCSKHLTCPFVVRFLPSRPRVGLLPCVPLRPFPLLASQPALYTF